MTGKLRTYWICAVLFIIAGVIGIFNHQGSIKYALIALGICFLALAARERKKSNEDNPGDDSK